MNCSACLSFADESIKVLQNLVSLTCSFCNNISDDGIKYLSQLISLHYAWSKYITDDGLIELPKLLYLEVYQTKLISYDIAEQIMIKRKNYPANLIISKKYQLKIFGGNYNI